MLKIHLAVVDQSLKRTKKSGKGQHIRRVNAAKELATPQQIKLVSL